MADEGQRETLVLARLRMDGGTQSRAQIDSGTVAEYAEAMRAGAKFPAIVVFHDGEENWLADGFHRVHALRETGADVIVADVRQGTRRDAILYSVGANGAHGLRRTNADKRRAVETLLRDEEWRTKSDRWIAEACGVGNKFVGDRRRELCTEHSSESEPRVGQDGKTRRVPVGGPAFDSQVKAMAESGFSGERIASNLGCSESAVGASLRRVPKPAREEPEDRGPTSRDEKVAALDERIVAVYQGEGNGSPKLTAEIVGVPRHRVHGALSRAGLNTASIERQDPLRNLVDRMNATAMSWGELANVAPWNEATEEQRAELLRALKGVLSRGRTIMRSIESMRGNEERASA